MSHWVFLDYVSPGGNNLVSKWSKKKLSVGEREDFETLLKVMAKQARWEARDFKTISGFPGLGEIRWKSSQRTPLRVAGTKGPKEGQYILLIGFSHKERVYDPPDPFNTAKDRKKTLDNGTGATCEHEEDDGEAGEE